MISMSPELVTFLMIVGILLGVLLGYPLALSVGGVGIVIGILLWGPRLAGELYYGRFFSGLENYVLLAVPMFVFMGIMLEHSGVAEGMYDALYLWFGGLKGGLAVTTILIGTVVAACVGIIGASVTMLALIALPAMINRGYDRSLAAGCVAAGGSLGILIPPSIMLVVYGPMAGLSVGRLFFGAFMPGFLLSALYMAYILVRCLVQPSLAPPVPASERAIPLSVKTTKLVKSMVPPVLLILAVLGSIFFGIAAPTEAAGVGALASCLLAAAYRRLDWHVLARTALHTVRVAGMVLLIGAFAFAFVFVIAFHEHAQCRRAFITRAVHGRVYDPIDAGRGRAEIHAVSFLQIRRNIAITGVVRLYVNHLSRRERPSALPVERGRYDITGLRRDGNHRRQRILNADNALSEVVIAQRVNGVVGDNIVIRRCWVHDAGNRQKIGINLLSLIHISEPTRPY